MLLFFIAVLGLTAMTSPTSYPFKDQRRNNFKLRSLPDDLSVEDATKQAMTTWNSEPLFHISSPKDGWNTRDSSKTTTAFFTKFKHFSAPNLFSD